MLAAFLGIALYAVQAGAGAGVMQAQKGHELLGADQNGWIELSTDRA